MLTKINKGMSRLSGRLSKEEGGFTLIELLIVLVIIGILLAIAVPSYLGFKKRAEKQASNSQVRAAIPAVEAFYADNSTYAGITLAGLKASYDSGLDAGLSFSGLSATAYTISATEGTCTASVTGPGGTISNTC